VALPSGAYDAYRNCGGYGYDTHPDPDVLAVLQLYGGMRALTGSQTTEHCADLVNTGNILVTAVNQSQHQDAIDAIIRAAGPDDDVTGWFYPDVVHQLHRRAICGENYQNPDSQVQ
jgi:hypothetical protein